MSFALFADGFEASAADFTVEVLDQAKTTSNSVESTFLSSEIMFAASQAVSKTLAIEILNNYSPPTLGTMPR